MIVTYAEDNGNNGKNVFVWFSITQNFEFIGQPNTTDSIGNNDRQANYHINNGSGGNVGKLL